MRIRWIKDHIVDRLKESDNAELASLGETVRDRLSGVEG